MTVAVARIIVALLFILCIYILYRRARDSAPLTGDGPVAFRSAISKISEPIDGATALMVATARMDNIGKVSDAQKAVILKNLETYMALSPKDAEIKLRSIRDYSRQLNRAQSVLVPALRTLQGHLDRSEIDQLTDMLKSVASVESDSNKDQNDFIRKVHDELTGAGSNPGFHLAQLNIAKFREPAMNTINNDFHAAIESVNKYAEAEPGFVWRLVDDGPEREGIPLFEDPDMLVNLTVWSDPESLMKFVYRTPIHRDIMRRREEWFDHMEFSMVLWWVKDGDRPSLKEAAEKLDLLAAKGATEDAFTFKERFPPPVQSTTSD